MTSLTNEQIVAELKWTEKAIYDTIGVTPIYWRPPFGKEPLIHLLGYVIVVLFFSSGMKRHDVLTI